MFPGQDESEYEKIEAILTPIAFSVTESDVEEALEPKFFIAADVSLRDFRSHSNRFRSLLMGKASLD